MRATACGFIGTTLVMLTLYFINGHIDIQNQRNLIIYTLVFICCATSQLIKQAKE